MTTPSPITQRMATQLNTAASAHSDIAHNITGGALYQQASQSPQAESLVKGQFEKSTAEQKRDLADQFIDAAGWDGLNNLTETPEGQYALSEVYDHASDDRRQLIRQVQDEQGGTAVDYAKKGGYDATFSGSSERSEHQICTEDQPASPEEQYQSKLMRQYSAHAGGEQPLPPEESLKLRNEIDRVSQINNPGQHNLWGDYSPEEKKYMTQQVEEQRKYANNLGIILGFPIFTTLPAAARVLGAPEPVVEGFGSVNLEMAGAKGLGRQARGIEPVRTPVGIGVNNSRVLEPAREASIDSNEWKVPQGADSAVKNPISLDSNGGRIKSSVGMVRHGFVAPDGNVYPKTLGAQKQQAVMDQLDVTFARSDEIIRKATETGRIPDVAQNRIVLREGVAGLPKRYNGNGLNYAFNNHANSAMAAKKSQFVISDQEVISILQDINVIASPISIANARSKKVGGLSLVRQVDLSGFGYGTIGKLPQNPELNGVSTSKITIITDGFGNLKNVFPGYLDDL